MHAHMQSLLAKHAALQARRAVWQEEWSTLGMTSGKTEQVLPARTKGYEGAGTRLLYSLYPFILCMFAQQYRHDKQDSILKNMRQQVRLLLLH